MVGLLENGVFYLGATRRPKIEPVVDEDQPVYEKEGYDADAPDVINARRFFGFTDYEEIDIYLLRSRRFDRKGHMMTQHYFDILAAELKR